MLIKSKILKQKTGLYFGTFNPIHIGHLIIAEYMVENTDLDEIWFVVTPSNPLKNKSLLLDEHHRYYMVNLATEEDNRFRACDAEFKLPYPSYTCHTLVYLNEHYPTKEFVLLMGEDNLEGIEKWKNWEYIMEHYQIYYYPRENANGSRYDDRENVTRVNAPKIELSATIIRENIKNKKSVKYMLMPKIEQYIDEMNFYKK